MSPWHRRLVAGAIPATVVFLLALAGVLGRWEWMEHADWAVLEPLYRYGVAHPGWVAAWDVLCTVFHPTVFRIVALIWIVYLLLGRRRDRYQVVLYLASTVEFSALLVMFVKAVVSRPRPETALVTEQSLSFPSGHALGTAVAVTAMVFAAAPWLRGRWRSATVVLGVVIVVAVGAGRVVLNVHHPSDVLAGWALGYLWALVCLPILTNRRLTAADETPARTGTGS